MRCLTKNYNGISKNRIFVLIKSLLTSPIFIAFYSVFAILASLLVLYKIGTYWIWINTLLIEQGYLPQLPDSDSMNDMILQWCLFQILILSISILLIICICALICATVDKVDSDLDKFDIEAQNDSLKREN